MKTKIEIKTKGLDELNSNVQKAKKLIEELKKVLAEINEGEVTISLKPNSASKKGSFIDHIRGLNPDDINFLNEDAV